MTPKIRRHAESDAEQQMVIDETALTNFMDFLELQLLTEASQCLGANTLPSPEHHEMWEPYSSFLQNLSTPARREKWVPFHYGLGTHELLLMEEIWYTKKTSWDEKQRFVSMFIFRSHCRRELFLEVQFPLMLHEHFWSDPAGSFAPDGPMEKSMLKYRRSGKQLQTGAFRIIPKRLCDDDDQNLVRSICQRSSALINLAFELYPLLQSSLARIQGVTIEAKAAESVSIYNVIMEKIQKVHGVGDTWVKMLMCCIDLSYPRLCLLRDKCEIGVGALEGLQRLIPDGHGSVQFQLQQLVEHINSPRMKARYQKFWEVLSQVERVGQQKYADMPMLHYHLDACRTGIFASVVQVQLCEWRQFLNPRQAKPTKRKRQSRSNSNPAPIVIESDSESESDLPLSITCGAASNHYDAGQVPCYVLLPSSTFAGAMEARMVPSRLTDKRITARICGMIGSE
eukprot:gnl/MRDRNA2_/MRDRNA2_27656_c0_seq1.p1 gnl/MRDRNA2_/MRDRNA2_27656_c0~~gnl/MRDRNA2_/MRDRNA2_27656_c0_seq1.p1  ORF type:complete len:454 (+),score=63.78 gnl/MRDRNA2_/MRDRNA2_27656_c0_seq1:56-1417(+)